MPVTPDEWRPIRFVLIGRDLFGATPYGLRLRHPRTRVRRNAPEGVPDRRWQSNRSRDFVRDRLWKAVPDGFNLLGIDACREARLTVRLLDGEDLGDRRGRLAGTVDDLGKPAAVGPCKVDGGVGGGVRFGHHEMRRLRRTRCESGMSDLR